MVYYKVPGDYCGQILMRLQASLASKSWEILKEPLMGCDFVKRKSNLGFISFLGVGDFFSR